MEQPIALRSENEAERLTELPWVLVRHAMGSPQDFKEKIKKLMIALWLYGDDARVSERLQRLQRLGYIDAVPNRVQRILGSIDMMRFFIVPAASDYYDRKGINFRFHTLLRFLDDPASIIDPTGFNSTRDAIIGHVMQVVHANPIYDLQLLESFEDGLDEMEKQVRMVLDGTHPRTESIQAIVEDPHYHEELLEHIRAYREHRNPKPLLRENVAMNPKFRDVEQTFGNVPNAMKYFACLPENWRDAAWHLWSVTEFPYEVAAA